MHLVYRSPGTKFVSSKDYIEVAFIFLGPGKNTQGYVYLVIPFLSSPQTRSSEWPGAWVKDNSTLPLPPMEHDPPFQNQTSLDPAAHSNVSLLCVYHQFFFNRPTPSICSCSTQIPSKTLVEAPSNMIVLK